MKNVLAMFVWLLAYVVPLHPVVTHSQSPADSPVITKPAPERAIEMVSWAEWMRLPHRRRRSRRPRLSRKVRRRIQLQLRRIHKWQRRTALKRQRERGAKASLVPLCLNAFRVYSSGSSLHFRDLRHT